VGIGQNSQWVIAIAAADKAGWQRPTADGYIESQFAGAKAALRPIFDRVRSVADSRATSESRNGAGTHRSYPIASWPPSRRPPGLGSTWACGSPLHLHRPG